MDGPGYERSAFRTGNSPEIANNFVGFRCVGGH
jgi:formylglycine-generating enzyme required for sulfatase activity